jgi:hypothetical protein
MFDYLDPGEPTAKLDLLAVGGSFTFRGSKHRAEALKGEARMTTKRSWRLWIVGSTASIGVLAVAGACSSEGESKFSERPADAEPDANDQGGFVFDGGGRPDSAPGPSACAPKIPATFQPAWKAPTRKSSCAPAELQGYYDACLTPASPDAGDPCKAFKDAHAECSFCVEAPDNTGPIQWHRERVYYTLNVAGCFSLLLNQKAEGQCPAAYAASVQCQRESCEKCFDSPDVTFSVFQKCQQSAKEDACKSYDATFKSQCASALSAADAGVVECGPKSSETAKEHFTRVMEIFCGMDD